MSSGFSSSDLEVLSRVSNTEELISKTTTTSDLNTIYEIERCAHYIKENLCTSVALQFPDYMLPDAAQVTLEMQKRTSANVYLLADTSYGSYDVDEVAAQHIQADLIIHYGKAAVTANAKIPTLYVFGGRHLNLDNMYNSFRQSFKDVNEKICILAQVSYVHILDSFYEKLASDYVNVTMARIRLPGVATDSVENATKQDEDFCTNSCPDCSCRTEKLPERKEVLSSDPLEYQFESFYVKLHEDTKLDDYSVFFIGQENSEMLRNFQLKHPALQGCVYDPSSNHTSQLKSTINKMLMKRYYVSERVKDANTVGILVGTMGMARFREIIKHLKDILKRSGKKSYTFVVGKLNPQKLANFPEIDVFVLVACPEEALVDSSDYYKPIATPYEVEVACNANRDWGEAYVTDFTDLLPGGKHFVEFSPQDEATVSLISGKVLEGASNLLNPSDADKQIDTIKQQALSVFHPFSSAQFYAERSWQGLEQKLGETPIDVAKEGRSGLPMSYTHEH